MALFFGPALRAAAAARGYANTAKAIQLTAVALEGSVAAARAGQAGYELYQAEGSTVMAAGYIGETFLRLFGIKANLKKAAPVRAAVADPHGTIEEFRRLKQGLRQLGDDLPRAGDGTVAYVVIDGRPFFGVNSHFLGTFKREKLLAWRQRLIEAYPDILRRGNLGQIPNDAFFHAEAMSLIRAYEKSGGQLPKKLTMYVDRVTCPTSCPIVLPLLAKELGVDEVTLIFKNNSRAIVRNGEFLRIK